MGPLREVDKPTATAQVDNMLASLPFPDIGPDIFSFTLLGFHIALRWYAMAYIVGIAIGWQLIKLALNRPHLWRDDTIPMPVAKLDDLLTYVVVGVIAGGRLGYVLFYKASYYLAHPIEIPQIWAGGMSFHGGFIGVVIGVYLFSRKHKVPLGSLADVVALSAPIAIGLVRCANFINGELWGRATTVPWGVVFPSAAAQSCATATTACARHPSQLYEAGLEGLLLATILIVLTFRFNALKKPWLLSAVFFTVYGLSRFILEFVRQPDAHFITPGNPLGLAFHAGGYGLTMGQALTLPMIVIGIATILYARRK